MGIDRFFCSLIGWRLLHGGCRGGECVCHSNPLNNFRKSKSIPIELPSCETSRDAFAHREFGIDREIAVPLVGNRAAPCDIGTVDQRRRFLGGRRLIKKKKSLGQGMSVRL